MMVVFVDIEQDRLDHFHRHGVADDDERVLHSQDMIKNSMAYRIRGSTNINAQNHIGQKSMMKTADYETTSAVDDRRMNPNLNAFSASLSCYPVIKQIAQSVDLNTLHALSRTCRQFRANLLPFRSQLVKHTLRCDNEGVRESNGLGPETILPQNPNRFPPFAIGKVGLCARDMVAECRRCTGVICRNCCTKPPSDAKLKLRLRRLCAVCLAAPVSSHLFLSTPLSSPDHGTEPHSFTASAFQRTPCSCEDSVWLCKPCGRTLINEDITYNRVWTWRTRYNAYLGGGLGTGIGEGCQGVKCGRGEYCLAAQDIEIEIDCCAEEWTMNHHDHTHGHDPHYHHHEPAPYEGREGRDDEEPGYLSQEIEGVGGVVKRKVKKRARIGACVQEYEDERETAVYLTREQSGQDRSWCGWCSRIALGKKDSIQN